MTYGKCEPLAKKFGLPVMVLATGLGMLTESAQAPAQLLAIIRPVPWRASDRTFFRVTMMVMDLRYGPPRECAFCAKTITVAEIDPTVMGIQTSSNGQDMQFWFCHAACFRQRVVGTVPPDDIPALHPTIRVERRYGPSGELRTCTLCRNSIQVTEWNLSIVGIQMLDGNWEGWFCHARCFSERLVGAVPAEMVWAAPDVSLGPGIEWVGGTVRW